MKKKLNFLENQCLEIFPKTYRPYLKRIDYSIIDFTIDACQYVDCS